MDIAASDEDHDLRSVERVDARLRERHARRHVARRHPALNVMIRFQACTRIATVLFGDVAADEDLMGHGGAYYPMAFRRAQETLCASSTNGPFLLPGHGRSLPRPVT